jgi:hypothetical protein
MAVRLIVSQGDGGSPAGYARRVVEAGLCAACRHARVVPGANSRFWLCERSRTDARYPRYPRLPVRRCPGHEPVTADPAGEQPARGPTGGPAATN